MTTQTTIPFTGFPREALAFLHELGRNNRREWFSNHRDRYERLVLEPARALVCALGPLLERRLRPGLRAVPRVDGSIVRAQRDARFVRGAPYRAWLELWFWEGEGPSRLHPGFFARLDAERFTVGAGIHRLPADRLARFRACVGDPLTGVQLAAVLRRLERGGWTIRGDARRRVPAGYAREHERAALLRRIGLWAECVEAELPAALFTPQLPAFLLDRFRPLRELHAWLAALE